MSKALGKQEIVVVITATVFFAIVGFAVLAYVVGNQIVYGYSSRMPENLSCSSEYTYNGISVCETSTPTTDRLKNLVECGDYVHSSPPKILINTGYPCYLFRAQILRHEACHAQQDLEGRPMNEKECKGWELGAI